MTVFLTYLFSPRLVLSILSAGLLVLVFPPFNLTWLAPVALTPLLIACALETRPKIRFLNGWIAGFCFWCGLCPWIQFVLEVHGGMGRWGGWGTFILFGLYKGLPMAVFATLAGFLLRRWWALPAVAALWTGIERTHGTFGFAWLDLGNAGIDMSLPMRLAPLTGVYGLSFTFAMLGCAVAWVLLLGTDIFSDSHTSDSHKRSPLALAWLGALLILFVLPRVPGRAVATERALIVQPNIDTEARWTEDFLAATERRLAALSRASGVSLIIWPEVPAPFYAGNATFHAFAANIAKTSETHFLFGAVAFTPRGEPLNSAVMLDPAGRDLDRYDKINLVPFGEFIPPPFGFVNRITHEVGDFSSGNRIVVFPVTSNGVDSTVSHRAGAFICYESAFPDLVRQFARDGAEVLINLSNDGYFGASRGHDQHLEIVRMRAAENQRWILRATNDGITAAIDPRGRVIERLPSYQQIAAIMPFGYEHGQTFYTRHGDWFAWACLVLGLLLSGYEWLSLKRKF